MIRTRTRTKVQKFGTVALITRYGATLPWIQGPKYTLTATETQLTTDDTRALPGKDVTRIKWNRDTIGKVNVGGLFTSTRRRVLHANYPDPRTVETNLWINGASHMEERCVGPRVPKELFASADAQWPPIPVAPTTSEMNDWGSTGVNRTIPTSPMWSAAQFIGELHEGLPSIPLKGIIRERSSRELGGEYLNYQFGIAPILSDFGDAKAAYQGAEERIRKLERGSGKPQRRRIELLNESATTVSEGPSTLYPTFNPSSPGGPGKNSTLLKITTTSSRRVWFSGNYTYFFKMPDDALGRGLLKARAIYGATPSVSTAWELTPWSWLVDWHSNVGTVLENLSLFASDGLVMRWGYVMCHQTVTREISWPGGSITLQSERKTRRFGNPFGFASSIDKYTTRQWAILGALGLSKGPNIRF